MFTLTNDAVEAEARRAAAWLADRGLGGGDRVAILASNRPGYVALTTGALRTAIVPVLLNPHLGDEERGQMLKDSDPALVVTDDDWPDLSKGPEAELADHLLSRPMLYTSGTTGRAKGVWGGVLGEKGAADLAADEQDLWDAREGETYLVCSPLYHSAPHRVVVSALAAGARVVVYERFDAAEISKAFASENVAGAFLVPTHMRRLLAVGTSSTWAPHARRILHAGEPCPESLKREAIEVFGAANLFEFYGSTEGQFTVCSSAEWLDRPGTVGRARPGRRIEIADPNGGGLGTVFVSAPPFARWEYWRDRAKTDAAWMGDLFTSGDIGRVDDDGYLFLEGRREDLIITGGVNVYPAVVERTLEEHPGVVEAAVFGVDDSDWGQRVCAAVVGDVDGESVRDFARARLPGSHAPKSLVVIDVLPRTASGKVKRSDLVELID